MDQAGAVLGGDVLGENDVVGAAHGVREFDQVERTLVAPALQVPAAVGGAELPALAQHGLGERLGDDQGLVAVGCNHVVDVRVGGDRRVRDQRPGGGGPHQQGRLVRQRAGREWEADVHRRVGDVLVALRELVVGQGGTTAGAVGGDAVVLDQQALGVDLLQRPPARLDVLGVHRPVGVVHVHPVAHAAGEVGEGVHVASHRLAAALVEFLDAVRLDVGLAVEPEFLLDGQLDRQPVAVPSGLSFDVVARTVRKRGNTSLNTRASMWWVPGMPLAVGGPS